METNSQVRVNKHGSIRVISEKELHQVETLAMMGATNTQLSVFFQVSESTIEYWLKNYPEFAEARQRGGMMADMEVVKSMYKRAVGYTIKEEKIFKIGRKLVRKKINVHVLPDPKCMMFWLSNRQREQWTQTQKVAHSGIIEHRHTKVEDIPINQLEPKTQEFLFEIAQKQLANVNRDN